MSYDLHLRPPEGKYLPTAVASDRIVGLGHVDGNGINFRYKHPGTGVYCTLDIEDDYISVALNVIRPRFFGMETMPLIGRLAGELNLEIFDPQQDRVVGADELLDLWLEQNAQAIAAIKPDLPYLDPEKSVYWWKWMRDLESLRKEKAPLLVPQIFLLADEARQVWTAAVWSARVEKAGWFRKRYLPQLQVFPQCDYLILAVGSERRYASRDAVAGPEIEENPGKVFAALKTVQTGKLERIGSDGFIDIAL